MISATPSSPLPAFYAFVLCIKVYWNVIYFSLDSITVYAQGYWWEICGYNYIYLVRLPPFNSFFYLTQKRILNRKVSRHFYACIVWVLCVCVVWFAVYADPFLRQNITHNNHFQMQGITISRPFPHLLRQWLTHAILRTSRYNVIPGMSRIYRSFIPFSFQHHTYKFCRFYF